jgi:hypothetical protein
MPILAPGPCWTRFVEFATTIKGTTLLLRGMAQINVEDCRNNPALRRDLDVRCRAALLGPRDGLNGGLGALPGPAGKPGPPPFRYVEEPVDKWQAFSVMAEQSPGQTILADCDCLSPMWAAFFYLAGLRAGLGISQPKTRPCKSGESGLVCGHGMAHAYTVLALDSVPARHGWLRALCIPMSPTARDARGRPLALEPLGAFDGSTMAGMPPPRDPGFYGSGESAVCWLHED